MTKCSIHYMDTVLTQFFHLCMLFPPFELAFKILFMFVVEVLRLISHYCEMEIKLRSTSMMVSSGFHDVSRKTLQKLQQLFSTPSFSIKGKCVGS